VITTQSLHQFRGDKVWQFIRIVFNKFADLADCKEFAFYSEYRLIGESRSYIRKT